MKSFNELTIDELVELRKEIPVGSMYSDDYYNSFDYNHHDIQDFFDGYLDFIEELAKDDGYNNYTSADWDNILDRYDNNNSLEEYFMSQDFDWIRAEEDNDD
jgi:hypothetical protein